MECSVLYWLQRACNNEAVGLRRVCWDRGSEIMDQVLYWRLVSECDEKTDMRIRTLYTTPYRPLPQELTSQRRPFFHAPRFSLARSDLFTHAPEPTSK